MSAASAAFEESLRSARDAMDRRDFAAAWIALERAHILGQPRASEHVRSHVAMLRCAWLQKDFREVFGQVIRVVLAGPSSAFRRFPKGNTGRARVGLFTPMALPPELERLLESGDRER